MRSLQAFATELPTHMCCSQLKQACAVLWSQKRQETRKYERLWLTWLMPRASQQEMARGYVAHDLRSL